MTVGPLLYHFTCRDHGQPGILRDRFLRPNRHPWFDRSYVWMTDQANPDRTEMGLTSTLLGCDRMEVRCDLGRVPGARRWVDERATLPPAVLSLVADLERFGAPEHWWVSTDRVPVLRTVRHRSPERAS